VSENGNAYPNDTLSANGNDNGSGYGSVAHAPDQQPDETDAPSAETLLFRTGLLTPDQLGELVQERVASGRPSEEIVVQRGWLDAATVARALGQEAPPAPAPPADLPPAPLAVPLEPTVASAPAVAVPVQIPEFPPPTPPTPVLPTSVLPTPAAAVHPAATPVPEPVAVAPVPAPALEATAGIEYRVSARYGGTDRAVIGAYTDVSAANAAALAFVEQLASEGSPWPQVGGRFVRPEAVTSVDVEAVVV